MLNRVTLMNFKFDEKSKCNICQLELVNVDERDSTGRLSEYRPFADLHKGFYNRDWRNPGKVSNCVAKSTDYACSYPDCAYHHALEIKVVLHVRSHFNFEVSSDVGDNTELCFSKGRYTCSACPRATADKICFREHLRHHLFQRPYYCPICSLSVESINQARKHFQSKHANQQIDLKFCESRYSSAINELVELVSPNAEPLRKPIKLFVVDSSLVHRNVEQKIVELTSSVYNKGLETSGLERSQDGGLCTSSTAGSSVERVQAAAPSMSLGGMSFSYRDGRYHCNNCRYNTESISDFRRHAWKHIHNSWGSDCQHRGQVKSSNNDEDSNSCSVLRGLLKILSVIDHTKKNNKGDKQQGSVPRDPVQDSEVDQQDMDMCTLRHDQMELSESCLNCSFTCNSKDKLWTHCNEQHGGRRKLGLLTCTYCNWVTDKIQTLKFHLAHHRPTGDSHELKYFACSECGFSTTSCEQMKKHEYRYHKSKDTSTEALCEQIKYLDNIFKCPICSQFFPWAIYTSHIRVEHKNNSLAHYLEEKYPDVSVCPEEITFSKNMLADAVAGENAVVIHRLHCDTCDFSSNAASEIEEHKKTHAVAKSTDVNTVSVRACSSCMFVSSSDDDYEEHVREHTKFDNITVGFSCSLCPYKHKLKEKIMEHGRKFHKVSTVFAANRIDDKQKQRVREIPMIDNSKKDSGGKKKLMGPKSKHTKKKKVERTLVQKERPVVSSLVSREQAVEKPLSTGTNADRQETSSHVPPVSSDEFLNSLPLAPVFPEKIMCPKCDYSNRFRVNLIRHYKKHCKTDALSEDKDETPNVQLSFGLWQPANCKRSDVAKQSHHPTKVVDVDLDNSVTKKVVENSNDKPSKSKLKEVKGQESSSFYSCEVCQDSYVSEADLKRHMAKKHKGPYVCHLCGMLISSGGGVRRHYDEQHCGQPVHFELATRRQREIDTTEETGLKKVARIQGILRSDESQEINVLSNAGCESTQPELPVTPVISTSEVSLVAGVGKAHESSGAGNTSTIDAFSVPASHPAANVTVPTPSPAVNPVPLPVPEVSYPRYEPTVGAEQQPTHSQVFPPWSSTSLPVPPVVNTTPWLSVSDRQSPMGMDQPCNQYPQQGLNQNFLSLFGNINIEALKSMIAANLVPVLMSLLSNPGVLMRTVGQSTYAVTPQMASIISQYLLTAHSPPLPPLLPVNHSRVNLAAGRPTEYAHVVPSTCNNETVAKVSPPLVSENNSQMASANLASYDMMPLSSMRSAEIQVPRRESPALSVASIEATVLSSDSDDGASKSEERGRTRKRSRSCVSSSYRSSSIESSISSAHSNKKRRLEDRVVYTCHLCSYSTTEFREFSKHMSIELSLVKSAKLYRLASSSSEEAIAQRCSYCSFSSFADEEFNQHVRTHVNINRFRCTYCSFGATSSKSIRHHMSRDHRDRPFALIRDRELTKTRPLNLKPVVRMVDVLRLSSRKVRRLKKKYDIGVIHF